MVKGTISIDGDEREVYILNISKGNSVFLQKSKDLAKQKGIFDFYLLQEENQICFQLQRFFIKLLQVQIYFIFNLKSGKNDNEFIVCRLWRNLRFISRVEQTALVTKLQKSFAKIWGNTSKRFFNSCVTQSIDFFQRLSIMLGKS